MTKRNHVKKTFFLSAAYRSDADALQYIIVITITYRITRTLSYSVNTMPAPSPEWGPRGQGPSKNRQGPGKNNWIDHV